MRTVFEMICAGHLCILLRGIWKCSCAWWYGLEVHTMQWKLQACVPSTCLSVVCCVLTQSSVTQLYWHYKMQINESQHCGQTKIVYWIWCCSKFILRPQKLCLIAFAVIWLFLEMRTMWYHTRFCDLPYKLSVNSAFPFLCFLSAVSLHTDSALPFDIKGNHLTQWGFSGVSPMLLNFMHG